MRGHTVVMGRPRGKSCSSPRQGRQAGGPKSPPHDHEREGVAWWGWRGVAAGHCRIHPPCDCEREGYRGRCGGMAWRLRIAVYTPHAIASARGIGVMWWRGMVVAHRRITPPTRLQARGISSGLRWRRGMVVAHRHRHPPHDCKREGMSVTCWGWYGREGMQPQERVMGNTAPGKGNGCSPR
ncbi:hypothetical protein BC826DRAFT_548900 [Russula brevipes]|nr:hypothetical protein BC826DRAFT_548900 [Russula brevipes]